MKANSSGSSVGESTTGSFRFADREESYEAGDAYYVPPGHTPIHFAGAEIVEFSPTDALAETIPVVLAKRPAPDHLDPAVGHEAGAEALAAVAGDRAADAAAGRTAALAPRRLPCRW